MPLPEHATVAYGDIVLLVGKDRRTFIRTVAEGKRFECHLGYIPYENLVGVAFGEQLSTHNGHLMFVLPPHVDDIIGHLEREGQIIYPKDLGYIALKLGIRPGMRVIEAGTGSGALTITLATLVGPTGHIYSYDKSNRMQERAILNVRRLDMLDRVTFHQRDIEPGFLENDVNALFLDVREPWMYLDQARAVLRGGGYFGTLVPTMNQVIDITQRLYDGPWFLLEIEELLLRAYKTVPARIRPDDQMVGHTGYLIFARAVNREDRTLPEPATTDEEPETPETFDDGYR